MCAWISTIIITRYIITTTTTNFLVERERERESDIQKCFVVFQRLLLLTETRMKNAKKRPLPTPTSVSSQDESSLQHNKTDGKITRQKDKSSSGSTVANSAAALSGLDEIDALFSEKKKKTKLTTSSSSSSSSSVLDRPNDPTRRTAKTRLQYTRSDMDLFGSRNDSTASSFLADGLGGKINKEGYTGRVEGGVKIFKAHMFNRANFGQSKDCPFDCDCCYI